MAKIWEMNVMSGKNPSHTAQFYNSFDNRGLTPSQVFAREGGQNASDAGATIPGLTEMRLYWLSLTGGEKKKFIKLLNLKEPLLDRLAAYRATKRHETFCDSVEEMFSHEELNFILIRDFNTCGLGGRWNTYNRGDHFARLVCALNLDDKSDVDPNLGGSFGLGKTTYSNSSKVQTVIYHSVFKLTDETDGSSRRLMTAGVYPSHEFKGKKYGGFAYHGNETPDNLSEAMPFENDEAKEIWENICGFFKNEQLLRANDQYGTDILILQPTVDLKEVKGAVEDFYWPAITERALSVTLYDDNGDLHHPNPIDRDDLRPFIDLHKKIRNEELVDSETLVVEKLRKRREKKTGMVAFEASPDHTENSIYNNTVALMRNTGMVINYAKLGADRFESARGVFVADKDIYEILITSENMAHSEWDKNSRRLERAYGEEGREIVQWVNNSIEGRFQEFQKNLQPDASISKNEHGFFAQLMSRALKGSKGNPPPPRGQPKPASISLTRKARAGNLSTWHLKLTDNEHTPKQEFSLKIWPSISIAGDVKRVSLKKRDIIIKQKDGSILARGTKPEIDIPFQMGAIFECLIELDAPGELNYVVACRCSAEIEVPEPQESEISQADL